MSGGIQPETYGAFRAGLPGQQLSPRLYIRRTKMKITEIIALAKAGYKKSDIDKIIEEEKAAAESEEIDEVEEIEEEKEEIKEEHIEEEKEEEPDYKALYEELKKSKEETEKKLKQAQKMNREKEIEKSDKTDEDIVSEMLRGLM